MSKRNELKQQYKQMKPDMGVFMIKSKTHGKVYLQDAKNLRGGINSCVFQLNAGLHPNKDLQSDWTQYGEDNFLIEILDTLEYAKDEPVKDYGDDLAELKAIWLDKLRQDNVTLYGE